MRKFVVVVSIFLTISFISCKKEKDKAHLINGIEITGTWKLIYYETINWSGGVGSRSFDTMELPCMKKNTFTIKADHTANQFYAGTDSCIWYSSGNLQILMGDPGGPPTNLTWTQSGDTLGFQYHTQPNRTISHALFLKSGTTNQLISWNDNTKAIMVK